VGSALLSGVTDTDGVILEVMVMLLLLLLVMLRLGVMDTQADGVGVGVGVGEATNISHRYGPVNVTGRSLSPCSAPYRRHSATTMFAVTYKRSSCIQGTLAGDTYHVCVRVQFVPSTAIWLPRLLKSAPTIRQNAA
jgi:hypothetical protein